MTEIRRYCEKCGCDLVDWLDLLKIEKQNDNPFYIKGGGYYKIIKGCIQKNCKNEIKHIEKGILGKDFKWLIESWEKGEAKQKYRFMFFILTKKEIEKILEERIKGVINEFNLVSRQEYEECMIYEIFGYNGEDLYIKQRIEIKK